MLKLRRGLLAAGMGVCLGLVSCSLVAPKFDKPVLSVVSIQMVSGSLLQQNFIVRFHIQNPNDRALPVRSLRADLILTGERVATGVNSHPFVVPARGDQEFDMNITANVAVAMLKLASHPNGRPGVDYELTGAAQIDLPFIKEIPFRQSGSLPWRVQ